MKFKNYIKKNNLTNLCEFKASILVISFCMYLCVKERFSPIQLFFQFVSVYSNCIYKKKKMHKLFLFDHIDGIQAIYFEIFLSFIENFLYCIIFFLLNLKTHEVSNIFAIKQ